MIRMPSIRALLRFWCRTRLYLCLPLISSAAACSEPDRTSNDSLAQREVGQTPMGRIPAIAETGSYRCKDDSFLYVDYFRDGTGAILRTRDGMRTRFIATTIGGPFITRDQTLERRDRNIVLTRAGAAPQSCGASR